LAYLAHVEWGACAQEQKFSASFFQKISPSLTLSRYIRRFATFSGGVMKRLVFDLDGTLTRDDPGVPYAGKQPDRAVAARLREYANDGFCIIIYTARNMATYRNSIGCINAHTLPVIIDWLKCNDIPYDEIHVGKPWCGDDGFYIDDRAIRPAEFVSLSRAQIMALVRPAAAP
jgi:capsule biosynthesis phosphatase